MQLFTTVINSQHDLFSLSPSLLF